MQLTATEPKPAGATDGGARTSVGSLIAAALAIPGLATPQLARAENVPEKPFIAFKYMNYVDSQSNGGKRMTVHSPSVFFQIPVKDIFAIDGSYVVDSVSGASPIYHSTLSGASNVGGIQDRRKAGDVKATRYFRRSALGLGYAFSREDDYDSNAGSIDARFSSVDNNTTFALGIGTSSDEISATNDPTIHGTRHTNDFLVGVTRVLTPFDLLQSNLTYSHGTGYFTDPYKSADLRPNQRDQTAWLTKYLHYFSGPGAALHSSYRYYHNDWGVQAHTIETAWYQPFATDWIFRPSIRYYTQRAADFYFDPPFLSGFVVGQPYSADHRLSAFGAVTLGVKVSRELTKGWGVDLKYETYEQRSSWRLGGDGSPGLENFHARWWQFGVSKRF